ncbi:MAG: efflux RND transporter periplasmic adaptor subunit, partial [Rhodothermales bacterium]|nr:efflux RND transporter periplasmic adaptor subunit [Rhodothermales bacterium]
MPDSSPAPNLPSPSGTSRPASKIKPLAWTLAALVVVGLIIWPKLRNDEGEGGGNGPRAGAPGGGRGGPGGGRPLTATYALVETQTLGDTLTATGTLVAWEEVDVNAEVAGRIVALNLPEGAFVRQGQTLATLDTRVLAAQTEALQAQLDLARVQAERLRQLFAIGGLSQQALDEAESRVRVLEAQVAQQRAEAARRNVVAPFAGRLGFRAVSVGAYVSPGQKLTTLRVTNP